MDAPVRLAIIGTGYMAQAMAAAIGHVPGLAVAGFVSGDPARAAQLAAAWGGRAFADLHAALADAEVDAIYIANRTAAHTPIALTALAAGRPVLCEKPCAVTAADARRLADAASCHGVLFMEAIATPFLPAIAVALEQATSGALGPLRRFTADFGYRAPRESFPGNYATDGGGVLLDRMIYPVALARMALGPVARVEAEILRDADGVDVDATVLLVHAGGGTSLLGASFLAELGNGLTIEGETAAAIVEAPLLTAETLVLRPAGLAGRAAPSTGLKSSLRRSPLGRRLVRAARRPDRRQLPYGASPYAPELAHFRDLVRAGAKASPVLPPSLSVEIAEILDQARDAGG